MFIHPTAIISRKARIDEGCSIGAYTVIHDGVHLEKNTKVDEFCIIGKVSESDSINCRIGSNSTIRSHSVIYNNVTIQSQIETGHHIVIRENSSIGHNLRIGNFSDIEGDCTIGDYNRFHGYVHVGKGTKIGNFTWLYSLSIATNDPLPPSHIHEPVVIEDGCVICVGATLMPGSAMRLGSMIAANSRAIGECNPGYLYKGDPAKPICPVAKLVHPRSKSKHPWMNHLSDRFPLEAQDRLQSLLKSIKDITLKQGA